MSHEFIPGVSFQKRIATIEQLERRAANFERQAKNLRNQAECLRKQHFERTRLERLARREKEITEIHEAFNRADLQEATRS